MKLRTRPRPHSMTGHLGCPQSLSVYEFRANSQDAPLSLVALSLMCPYWRPAVPQGSNPALANACRPVSDMTLGWPTARVNETEVSMLILCTGRLGQKIYSILNITSNRSQILFIHHLVFTRESRHFLSKAALKAIPAYNQHIFSIINCKATCSLLINK